MSTTPSIFARHGTGAAASSNDDEGDADDAYPAFLELLASLGKFADNLPNVYDNIIDIDTLRTSLGLCAQVQATINENFKQASVDVVVHSEIVGNNANTKAMVAKAFVKMSSSLEKLSESREHKLEGMRIKGLLEARLEEARAVVREAENIRKRKRQRYEQENQRFLARLAEENQQFIARRVASEQE